MQNSKKSQISNPFFIGPLIESSRTTDGQGHTPICNGEGTKLNKMDADIHMKAVGGLLDVTTSQFARFGDATKVKNIHTVTDGNKHVEGMANEMRVGSTSNSGGIISSHYQEKLAIFDQG